MHHPTAAHDHVALVMEIVIGVMLTGFAVLMVMFPWEYGKLAGDFYEPAKAWTGWRRYLAGLVAMLVMFVFLAAFLAVAFGPAVGLAFLSIKLTGMLPFLRSWAEGDRVMLRGALALTCAAGWLAAFAVFLNRDPKSKNGDQHASSV